MQWSIAAWALVLAGHAWSCTPVHAPAEGPNSSSMGSVTASMSADNQPPQPPRSVTYSNPVVSGFNADPSICRVGDDYYLVSSTFEYFPGVPVFHSKDLVHWRLIGHALTRASQVPLAGLPSSKGIFAPTIRYHDGTFYMITTNMEGGGSFYVTASDPAGEWSEPVWLKEPVFTMDPSLFFDDDGKVYYTRHGEGRHGGVFQAEIDLASGTLKEPPRLIWKGTGGIWPEGPHLYKKDGFYYLLISEGGTSYEHEVTVARSKSPWGPFEANPSNPIITHRYIPEHPFQALGHADLVQVPSGAWFMVMLGIRPTVGKHHHLGRETFLAPVSWSEDGWPIVNQGKPLQATMTVQGLPTPHPWPARVERDDFDGPKLGLEWNLLRNPPAGMVSTTDRAGWLRLVGHQTTLSDVGSPAFVGRRQRHFAVRASTRMDFVPKTAGHAAGVAVRADEDNHYLLLVKLAEDSARTTVELRRRIRGTEETVAEHELSKAGPLVLTVHSTATHYSFSFQVDDGPEVELGQVETVPLSSENTGGFTGAYIGLYATSGSSPQSAIADFDWFSYQHDDR